MYNVDYFIDKFTKIPYNNWHTGQLTHPYFADKHCALGHCSGYWGQESGDLNKILGCQSKYNHNGEVIMYGINAADAINDGHHPAYKQKHPKDRILMALKDAKRALEEKRETDKAVEQVEEILLHSPQLKLQEV